MGCTLSDAKTNVAYQNLQSVMESTTAGTIVMNQHALHFINAIRIHNSNVNAICSAFQSSSDVMAR